MQQHRAVRMENTENPDKGLTINGCLQSAAPPLVPPVTVVQPNKCLTLSKNPQATANSAPPSICSRHAGDEQFRNNTRDLIHSEHHVSAATTVNNTHDHRASSNVRTCCSPVVLDDSEPSSRTVGRVRIQIISLFSVILWRKMIRKEKKKAQL